VDYRLATLEDVPALSVLNKRLTEDEDHPNQVKPLAFFEQRMRRFLMEEYDAILFEIDGEIVAYALYTKYGDQSTTIYLRQFFVQRDHRRRGIGKEAMHILKEQVWPQDKRLTVSVLWHNKAGRAFWQAVGYEPYSLDLEIEPGMMRET
jgi:predicted acetyltransferase